MHPAFDPPEFVLAEQEPQLMSNSTSLKEIPIIDMQQLITDDVLMNSELQKLDFACKEWGIFQLVNHGVNTALVENLKLHIQEFFDLPLEEKNRFEQEPGASEGFGRTAVSEKQKLDPIDTFSLVTLPSHLRKAHLLPKLPAQFRETLEAYSAECKNLAMKILNQIAKALGMKLEDMTLFFEEGMQSMTMRYYPPCPQQELAIGLYPHSDCMGLTILLQASDVDGLQVKKDGAWVPAVPLPNAFIIIIGDILEIFTNGIYKSVWHRVTINNDEARLSIATFLSPRLDGDIGPDPSLITPETPAKFKRNSLANHFSGCISIQKSGLISRTPVEKSYLDSVKI